RGEREGIGLFRANGQILGEFAHISIRTTPMLGGACTMRESITMPPELRKAAISLVEAIDLEGYSQVEFRRDANGRPLLMEVNSRLSGSIELASRAGVDFALMTWQWASGGPVQASRGYRSGVRLRWLAGDGRWLLETLRAPERPDATPALRAIAGFTWDFARSRAYDFVDAGDLMPAVAEGARVLAKLGQKLSRPPRLEIPPADALGTIWYQER
ncbi:MAG TPA: ATP-grasp domain-containing protein, partial [Acidimicrobiales bacterium]|nr:ATP-grasp domain-containing protein [Acidimicrobiales bacterium]